MSGPPTGGSADPAVSVLVADDQPLVRAGLVMLLNAQPAITVVAEATSGRQAVDLARAHRPDVVLMDLRMPDTDGITATRLITQDHSDGDQLTKVLVVTAFHDDDNLYGALRAGASGFLLKHAAPQELTTAIRRVAGGDAWIDPAVANQVIAVLAALPAAGVGPDRLAAQLTPRELEIFVLVAHGLSNTEIATRLVLSMATVKTHVARIIIKTGSRDRSQAVALAYQSGVVVPGQQLDRRS